MKYTIEKIQKQIDSLEKFKRGFYKTEPDESDDYDTMVFKLYVTHQSGATVASILNERGYRVTSQAGSQIKLISTNVTSIIREHEIADKDLEFTAKAILDKNTAAMDRLYN